MYHSNTYPENMFKLYNSQLQLNLMNLPIDVPTTPLLYSCNFLPQFSTTHCLKRLFLNQVFVETGNILTLTY